MFRYGCGFLGSGMFGGGWFMMLVPILVTGIILYGAYKILNNNRYDNKRMNDNIEALRILNEKFAKGEIDEEEYLRKKRILND